ncbi:MAG: hypothetical protein HYR97_01895 [Candidatus Melainabacteria bacterium]|nr:hypothetical protein [Candidatus Melainabacteria bacterium]
MNKTANSNTGPTADRPVDPDIARLRALREDDEATARKASVDEFFSDDDSGKGGKGEPDEAEKASNTALVESLIAEASGLLASIGTMMRANINANPIMQFAKHDWGVGVATKAAAKGEEAHTLSASKKLLSIVGSATNVSNIAKGLRGLLITGAELWKGFITADRDSNKNVQKVSDRT